MDGVAQIRARRRQAEAEADQLRAAELEAAAIMAAALADTAEGRERQAAEDRVRRGELRETGRRLQAEAYGEAIDALALLDPFIERWAEVADKAREAARLLAEADGVRPDHQLPAEVREMAKMIAAFRKRSRTRRDWPRIAAARAEVIGEGRS